MVTSLQKADSNSNYDTSSCDEDSDVDYLPCPPKHPSTKNDFTSLKRLLPQELATDERWMGFFQQQLENCKKHHKRSVSMIQVSIDLFTRSLQAYKNLSHVLRLPSAKQLMRYKNFVNQRPGLVEENLHWMYLEAKRRRISPEGHNGFIVFDEMSIQADLQMESAQVGAELVGFTDYGKAQGMHMLRKHGGLHALASHILQFIFLGYKGFSWPVCYFATTEAQGSELMVMVWQVVNAVQNYGFKINGMLMDGGANNRKFVRLHCGSKTDLLHWDFRLTNPVHPDHQVTVMMDPSHGIKKLRNSCLASSKDSTSRQLRWGKNFCLWKHWEDAYHWNEATVSFKVYHKLTEEHIYPNEASKMRNHLALEVLNSEMLHLMQEFQITTGRTDLVLTLQLLQHTSQLVKTFCSDHPVTNVQDSRLEAIKEALQFFREWHSCTRHDSTCFITKECFEDLLSTVTAFESITKHRLREFPGTRVVPSIMNSDVIENFFALNGVE